MHQTVDSLVLYLSSFCPHFVLAWIRSVYTNKRPMTVQSDLHSEALLEYSVRRTILVNLFPLPHWSNYGQSARRVFRNVAWGIGPIPDTLSFQTLILWQKYGVRQEKSEIWENWGHRESIKKWSVISDSAVCIESIAQSVQEIASCCDCHVSIHLTMYTPPNVVSRRRCFPCVCVGGGVS